MRVEAAEVSGLAPVTAPALAALPWLVHGFSTRAGGVSTVYGARQTGDLNLGFTAEDKREAVEENRSRLLAHLSGAPADRGYRLITIRQVHAADVLRVRRADASGPGNPTLLEGDGLVTDEPGVVLGILTADCVPVLVVDRRRRVVAAFHAGWRGTSQRIVELGVTRMQAEFGSAPEDLLAAIGPAIGSCCYAVGEEVRELFASRFEYAAKLYTGGQPPWNLNLAEANRRQLLAAGIGSGAIFVAEACTSCQPGLFFSHRAQHGVTGRMMATVGIRLVEST